MYSNILAKVWFLLKNLLGKSCSKYWKGNVEMVHMNNKYKSVTWMT